METTKEDFDCIALGLQAFLEKLGNTSSSFQRARFQSDKERLLGFLPVLGLLHQPIRAARKREAPNYNLFHVLKIRHYEARVHTPFLVNLLSPKGSHAQGDLFYRSFVEQVLKEEYDERFRRFERLEVTDEQHTGDLGFIDIWIRNHSHTNRHCIIIENKIYAGDQSQQLERYYDYALRLGFAPEEIRLFYLTLHPTSKAEEYSIKEELRTNLEELRVLRYISYQKDILPWLHNVKDKVEAPVVQTIIRQYLSNIYSLLQ